MTFTQTCWAITGIFALLNLYIAIKSKNTHSMCGWLSVILASLTIVF